MHKLIALFYFILSLAGCDHADRSIVMRSTVDGTDLFYSRVSVTAIDSVFRCIHSQSGQCHYGVFEHDCASTPACTAPLRQFAMNAGTERKLSDLPPDFELCVSADASPITRDCLRPETANKASLAAADGN